MRAIARLRIMSRSRIQLCSVTFLKAQWIFWHVLAVHVCLSCKKQWASGKLSGIGKRLEFKFQYAKELLFWAVCGRGLGLVCVFVYHWFQLIHLQFQEACPQAEVWAFVSFLSGSKFYLLVKKTALWFGAYKFAEKLIKRATQVSVGAQPRD